MSTYDFPHPAPSVADQEKLTVISEECAEIIEVCTDIIRAATNVQKRATKAARFGLDEKQTGQSMANAERLAIEYGDLLGIMQLAGEQGILDLEPALSAKLRKLEKLRVYLRHKPTVAA